MSDVWKIDRRRLTDLLAPWIFGCSLAFLALVAAIVVLVIDVPRVNETISSDEDFKTLVVADQLVLERELDYESNSRGWGFSVGIMLLGLWPVFFAELLKDFWLRDRSLPFFVQHRFAWLFCVFPPLRLCRRDREEEDRIWFPVLGWQKANYQLRKRLDRAFSVPMVFVSLLILPVLVLQFFFMQEVAEHPLLRFVLHFNAGLIWFCFAFEFIVMVSVAQSKFKYCKQHWLDLLIIILPLVSFLRTLQSLRATKLLKAAKLQQIARLVRVYRLRGLSMRGFRALLLLEVLNRVVPTAKEKRLKRLREELEEKVHEIEDLRKQIAVLEEQQRVPDRTMG